MVRGSEGLGKISVTIGDTLLQWRDRGCDNLTSELQMSGSARTPLLYRRAILIYLLAIVAPTVVLLYLGLLSVERQNAGMNALLISNRRLSAEKLAAAREQRTALLAGTCLREAQFLKAPATVDSARQLRTRLEALRLPQYILSIYGEGYKFVGP